MLCIVRVHSGEQKVSVIQSSGVLKSMEKQSGLSELSVISWVSPVEGCQLSGVPLYYIYDKTACGACAD